MPFDADQKVIRGDPFGAHRQAQRLRLEGVLVSEQNGEFRVDLNSAFGWFPARLPSDPGSDVDAESGGVENQQP